MKFGAVFLLLWALCQKCSSQQSRSVSASPTVATSPPIEASTMATPSIPLPTVLASSSPVIATTPNTIALSATASPTVATSPPIEASTMATPSIPLPTVLASSSPVIAATPNTTTAVRPTSVGLLTTYISTSEISTSKVFIAPTISIYPSLSLDSMVQITETTLVVTRLTSSPTPTTGTPPEEPSTETPTSFVDFVMDNSVGFSIVGVSLFFVLTMCGGLVLVLCCRKRLIKIRQKTREEKILDQAGDVWIVNHHTLRSDSSGLDAAATHTAAAGALQRPPDRALILSNPQASQSSLLEYHDMGTFPVTPSPKVSASGIVLSPMSHHSSITQLLPSGAQNTPNPSAPPKHLI